MAARSVQVVICNLTTSELFLIHANLQHGKWSSTPPVTIAANTINAQFGSQSHGFMTGTQGDASYAIGSPTGSTMALTWDDPFIGNNSYSANAPSSLTCIWQGGNGNNATVFFILFQPPSAPDWMQANLAILGSNALRHLCIPGSHDSGMSKYGNHTVFAYPCNTQTQTTGVFKQLSNGARYFDIRPVISDDLFETGHYSKVGTWQGANGQSIASIIQDVNNFTNAYGELVIINLSHDLNTDLGTFSYAPFTQADWDRLLSELSFGINNPFISNGGESNGPPAGGDMSVVSFNGQLHVCYFDCPFGGMQRQPEDGNWNSAYSGSWIWDISSSSGLPVGWQLQQLTGTGSQAGGGLSGYAFSAPAAINFNKQLHVFYLDASNSIWDVWMSASTAWQLQQITGPNALQSAAAIPAGSPAVVIFQGMLTLCYSDIDGSVWSIPTLDGTTWQPPQQLVNGQTDTPAALPGRAISGAPVAGNIFAAATSTQLFVGYLDASSAIWCASFDGVTWQPPQQISGANGAQAAAPMAAAYPVAVAFNDQMHICYTDSVQGVIWDLLTSDGGMTWKLQQLTGPGGLTQGLPAAAGSPAAIVFSRRLHICYRDKSGSILDVSSRDGVKKWRPRAITGPSSQAPNAPPAVTDPRLGVFETTSDLQLHICYQDPTGVIQDAVFDINISPVNNGLVTFGRQQLNGPDLTRLPLKTFIGAGRGAVAVIVDPSDNGINLGANQNLGFFRPYSFPVYNQYSDTNDLGKMIADQLTKMQNFRLSPDENYFLLSWTLTQSTWQALTCSKSILDLAREIKGPLYADIVPVCSSQTFPNILYTDDVWLSAVIPLVMLINTEFAS